MAGKVKYRNLSQTERKIYLGEFYSMVSLLKSRDEVKRFFKDLLTLSEVVMISRRIQVAKMLLEGYFYKDIRKKLGVGFSTIRQVDRWLRYGFGGYKEIIKKYKKKYPEEKQIRARSNLPFSVDWLKKKYPLHFLLFNLTNKK
ncbi:MAG: YerC/YecD family TrpR-related protein [bacterium]